MTVRTVNTHFAKKHALLVQILPYNALLETLELPGVRALEDFVIQHCIYSEILKCKLDQVNSCVHIHSFLQRDVRPEELPALTKGLEDMYVLPYSRVRLVWSTEHSLCHASALFESC